ncbi:hypothetical protein GOP47_0022938 [Adiantum capillus-veneris]|uniref:C2H2-type domain-containing protein n=1 Tax=Adiantum capillus-veneris TaxID=13818 RepID=A0A9D4U8A9_ADICA|nr:hypothetical protein GOP47_0022938 [Adiantum capillus-veneris]
MHVPSLYIRAKKSDRSLSETKPVYIGDTHLALTDNSTRAKVEAAVFVSRRVYMRSGCSRSIANLRDVIHSSRRIDGARLPAMPNFSPKSVESNDFVQSISHETLLQEQGCDNHSHYKHPHSLQGKLVSLDDIVANHHPHPYHHHKSNGSMENITMGTTSAGSFYGTPLHPSSRGAYAHPDARNGPVGVEGGSTTMLPPVAVPKAVCQRCGEAFFKYEALEQHHLLKHAVAELEVGDSSRNVVEIIFRTSWLRSPEPSLAPSTSTAGGGGGQFVKIERVLKVNNLARTLARFEDYREGVKMRASKLPKKHPRCLADGNELLRFYKTRLECELQQAGPAGVEGAGSTSVAAACSSATCSICKIIRTGFPKIRGPDGAANRGITTTATSGRAHQLMVGDSGGGADVGVEGGRIGGVGICPKLAAPDQGVDVGARSIRQDEAARRRTSGQDRTGGLMAMLVCRVIAGRVHKPPHTTCATSTMAPPTPPHSGDLGPPSAGFDSVAGGELGANGSLPPPAGMGLHSRFEELTVFNPRAILPCFVVLYRCRV